MVGCNKCITQNVCVECNYYYGLDYDTDKCKLLNLLEKKYYFDNKDKTYKKCDYGVDNCLYCNNRDFCYKCKSGYFFIEIEKNDFDHSRCYSLNDLSYKSHYYYAKNNTYRALCSSKIDGCQTCNSAGSKCKSCLPGYQWYKKKYCVTSRPTSLPHCLISKSSNFCLNCTAGYTNKKKERYGKCFPIPKDDYYFNQTSDSYIKCLDSPNLEYCLRCENGEKCIQCDPKIHVLINGKCIRVNN
jgi:hypothetical protein